MSQFLNNPDRYTRESSHEIDFDDAIRLPKGGSTCDIYRTRWQRREVFVKRLKEEFRSKPLYLDALDKEFEIGVQLRHTSLPIYHEFHRDYIVMDFVDGQTLAEMIKRNDEWLANERNIVKILKELVDVVDYLHRHNIVHCDIKPDNIIITSNTKNLVLIDFDKSYIDALGDTSGHPGKYGLSTDHRGHISLDFYGIGKVVERLKECVSGFTFSRFDQFVDACYSKDVNCETLAEILIFSPVNEQSKARRKDIEERLFKAFRRKQDPKTMYKCVPRHISIGTLQAAKNMQPDEIKEVVQHSECFRLRNLATAAPKGSQAVDQIAVEMFPHNTDYGCCIDRGADITIVCPTALSEAGIGNFAYYLALIGGFNYISKEVDMDIDDPTSFYIISDPRKNEQLAHYLADIRRLSSDRDHWTIFLISSETKKDADIHFLTCANAHTDRTSTVIDSYGFDRLYEKVTSHLEKELCINSDLNQLRPAGSKNAAVIIGGGVDTNAFTIRIFSELIVWDVRYMALAKTLATDIAMTLSKSKGDNISDSAILKESGFGYQEKCL